MRILIVSDTHKRLETYKEVLQREKPLDMIIHCGDTEGDEDLIREFCECKAEIVLGNNDFFSNLPRELEIVIGKYNVWITHGHNYYVSMGNTVIKEEAKARGMDIVIYGHTHKPIIDKETDIIALNPGSLTYPRQDGKTPSYIMMEVDEKGETDFIIHYL